MRSISCRPFGWLIFVVALFIMANGSAASTRVQVDEPTSEDVTISNQSVQLAATLIMPSSPPPYSVVVVVHGASPNTRTPLRNYATNVFARNGIAALIYDKRGAGQSSGELGRASLSDLASDVRTVVQYLKGRDDIRHDAIGLVGDSQAGWVIPLASAGNPDVAFLAMISASGVSPSQQEVYSITRKVMDFGLGERLADIGRKGRLLVEDYALMVRDGPAPAPAAFRESAFVNLNLLHDPVPVLEQIAQPVLIILGGADAQVPTAHSAAVMAQALNTAGNRGYTIRIYPDAAHGIQVATSGTGSTAREYAPGYRDGLVTWIAARARGEGGREPYVDPGAEQDSAAFGPDGIYGRLPWYGRASIQGPLLLLGLLGFGASFSAVVVHVVRRRSFVGLEPGERWLMRLVALTSLLYFVTILGLIGLVIVLLEGGRPLNIPFVLRALPLLAVLTIGSGLALLAMLVTSRQPIRSSRRAVWYYAIALLTLVFVPFFAYWNLLGLTL